jgi:hypothetical protein
MFKFITSQNKFLYEISEFYDFFISKYLNIYLDLFVYGFSNT